MTTTTEPAFTLEEQTENVLQKLASTLYDEHEKIDREHQHTIKTGPRKGTIRYDDRYNHGYRDALENVRMAVVDALAELRAS